MPQSAERDHSAHPTTDDATRARPTETKVLDELDFGAHMLELARELSSRFESLPNISVVDKPGLGAAWIVGPRIAIRRGTGHIALRPGFKYIFNAAVIGDFQTEWHLDQDGTGMRGTIQRFDRPLAVA